MAGLDAGGESRAKKKGSGLRRPKRRLGIRIDMTPMVDIAFLLLIFYMVTTIFTTPQAMEVNLPKDDKQEIKIAESNLLTIRISKEGQFYENIGAQKPKPVAPKQLRNFLVEKNKGNPEKLVTLIRIHKEAPYSQMVYLIDEIQVAEQLIKETIPAYSSRFAFDTWTAADDREMERAANGGSE
jgi:biopolymer transport protein ExbD